MIHSYNESTESDWHYLPTRLSPAGSIWQMEESGNDDPDLGRRPSPWSGGGGGESYRPARSFSGGPAVSMGDIVMLAEYRHLSPSDTRTVSLYIPVTG